MILGLGFLVAISLYKIRIPVVKYTTHIGIQVADKVTMSVLIPKGLAAAVLAGIPLQKGIPGGQIIQDITYSIILITIILTSLLIPMLGRYKRLNAIYGWFFRIHFK